ncbi:MAG: hypothetical protein ABL900_17295 [Burkholderiaceae bacterium]
MGSSKQRQAARPVRTLGLGVAIVLAGCAAAPGGGGAGATGSMSFFVTSTGVGKGADLGGLAGADQHCQALAGTAGAGTKTWRAYLSTQGKDGAASINARDRIGKGPWYSAKGELVARDVDQLHGAASNVTKQTALSEKGQAISGRGDTPNRHDILTGSRADGTAFAPGDPDMTCGNWTRSGAEGVAVVGHHDRSGPTADAWSTSWNSSHQSRGGCSQTALKGTGGDGLLYCFAAN